MGGVRLEQVRGNSWRHLVRSGGLGGGSWVFECMRLGISMGGRIAPG